MIDVVYSPDVIANKIKFSGRDVITRKHVYIRDVTYVCTRVIFKYCNAVFRTNGTKRKGAIIVPEIHNIISIIIVIIKWTTIGDGGDGRE